MNFKPQINVELANLTTMKIGGKASYFTEITNTNQLLEVSDWLQQQKLPSIILGGGSNIIFDDGVFEGLVLKIDIKGFEKIKESNSTTTIRVGAGENLDETIRKTINLGLCGVEALSGIPGTCGAAPVQNIGAYGQEIRHTLAKIHAFDRTKNKMTTLTNSDCKFAYRDSIFKSSQKGRYIISSIDLTLSKKPPKIPEYKDIQEFFCGVNNLSPTAQEIRSAVINIRSKKFTDPSNTPNAGSFFKNPIVGSRQIDILKSQYPDIKVFDLNDGKHKLFAGWLIEQAGLKGVQLKRVRVDPNHALVLQNTGKATLQDLRLLIDYIQKEVKNKFDINLEPEPEIVKF